MKQLTLASVVGFERYSKTTRQTAFLAEMERVVPWPALCALIKPFYPKPGNGRPPVGIERMLRIYFLQHWFNLSDPAVEETLYDGDAAFCRHQPWSRAGQPAVRRVAAAPGGGHRHDRRCDYHQCADFDQECRQGARSTVHTPQCGAQAAQLPPFPRR
jgi:hypothetical protein